MNLSIEHRLQLASSWRGPDSTLAADLVVAAWFWSTVNIFAGEE